MSKLRGILFGLYIAAVLYVVMIAGNDHRNIHFWAFEKPINLIPFKEKISLITQHYFKYTNDYIYFSKEIVGNLLLLFPLPFFLVWGSSEMSFRKVVLICMGSSIAIEVFQLVSGIGSADVDDVILNTLGSMLGTVLAQRIRTKKKEPGTVISKTNA